jgi:hypothetical protein
MQENMIISDHDPKVQGATSIAGIDALLARIGGGLRHRGLRVACVCEAWWTEKCAGDVLGAVRRLYSNESGLHHKYDSLQHATIGGLDFYVDFWPRSNGEKIESGSDREHINALIHAKGYKIPGNMMYVRLVNLLDADKRKELMIIYGED